MAASAADRSSRCSLGSPSPSPVAALFAPAGRGLGRFGADVVTADRPATGFVTQPDRWSLVVAVLAGIAGIAGVNLAGILLAALATLACSRRSGAAGRSRVQRVGRTRA